MKYIVILICMLMLSLQSFSQKRESCIPHKDNRSLAEFKETILHGTDPFIWRELWPEYVRLIKRALASSTDSTLRAKGIALSNTQQSVRYIMDHSYEYDASFADWSDYYNGTKVSGRLDYTSLKGLPSNWVGFKDGDVEAIYAKLACANPQDAKNPPTPYTPPTPPPPPPVKKDEPKKEVEEKEEKEEVAPQQIFIERQREIVVRDEPDVYYRGYQPIRGYGQITISSGNNRRIIRSNPAPVIHRTGHTGSNPPINLDRRGKTGSNPIQNLLRRAGHTGG